MKRQVGKTGTATTLKSYPAAWEGQLLLACGKCQRKLKGDDGHGLAKLKKALKQRSKRDPHGVSFVVLKTQCLKVCPKGGVTVLTQAQVGLGRFAILQTGADIDALYEECKADEPGQSLQLMQPGIREAGEGKKKRQTR